MYQSRPSFTGAPLSTDFRSPLKGPPSYSLEAGLEEVKNIITQHLNNSEYPFLINVGGGSASGKTMAITSRIQKAFPKRTQVVSMDDYYRGLKFMREQERLGRKLNWDQPEALNIALIQDHLHSLLSGIPIEKPKFCMKESEPIATEIIEPKPLILLEGIFALHESERVPNGFSIFVENDFHGRVLRRLIRDKERTNRSHDSILNYFISVVEPMHRRYVQPTMKNADLIIQNQYIPGVESKRAGNFEFVRSFPTNLSEVDIIEMGAERVFTDFQIDRYCIPHNLSQGPNSEIMIIRKEYADQTTFNYYGPEDLMQNGQRAKLSFSIDDNLAESFLRMHGPVKDVHQRKSHTFSLDGIPFALVKVINFSTDSTIDGNFLEFNVPSASFDPEKIQKVWSKLNVQI